MKKSTATGKNKNLLLLYLLRMQDFVSFTKSYNVPLAEIIEICADALYNGELTPPPFPGAVFVELMQTATSSIEFSFQLYYATTD